MQNKAVAVVGIGCRYPGGIKCANSFWNFLCRGGDGITSIPESRWNLHKFYSSNKDKKARLYMHKGGFLDEIDQFEPQFFKVIY
jgi:acyl transferase domain-containing protein